MLDEFLKYIGSHVDRAIYVWGAQGQLATDALIDRRESSPNNRTRAKALLRKREREGVSPIYAFDCSGLAMSWLQERVYGYDMSSNSMLAKCRRITRGELMRGDWVFRVKDGRAYHVGFVADEQLNVIEAKGRDDGVVKRPLAASGRGYWNAYGRPLVFKDEIERQTSEWGAARVLKKGVSGADVAALQKALISAGYALSEFGADGSFGRETEKAVLAYQADNALTPNGRVSKTMVRRLGGEWRK